MALLNWDEGRFTINEEIAALGYKKALEQIAKADHSPYYESVRGELRCIRGCPVCIAQKALKEGW